MFTHLVGAGDGSDVAVDVRSSSGEILQCVESVSTRIAYEAAAARGTIGLHIQVADLAAAL